eukprot:gnl/MRDRNA2_/MRDRNA2_84519_c0_seq1.p1 gnl/MRDRNA2_/MRDRNA2_84519_c0~~gnl/MRDRNA2_/MRDRNA2_84519_c0_seq1.p1  ORF type:complete len:459 (+),score=91.64 gnl/MRDRNA2_/MRDRNA2_84519_c0_seq1:103-1479(+)
MCRILVLFALLNVSTGLRLLAPEDGSHGTSLMSMLSNSTAGQEGCPKVFIYDLPKKYMDYDPTTQPAPWENKGGEEGAPFMRATSQYGLAAGILWRVVHSKRCLRVTDPSEADMFIIPILSRPKSGKKWAGACSGHKITAEELMPLLPHMTEENAHKHVVFVGKGHPNAGYSGCDAWWRRPEGMLRKVWRVSYSEVFDGKGQYGKENETHHAQEVVFSRKWSANQDAEQTASEMYMDSELDFDKAESDQMDYENMVSAPYMSDFHWSLNFTDTPPWKETNERDTLMAFFGTIRTKSEYSTKIRPFLADKCHTYGDACKIMMADHDHMALFNAKRQTKFCLEPPGDSPYRKSISESILAGCIPVMFSRQTDIMAPWHWGPWKDDSRVFIPAQDLYSGKVDLKEVLESIPEERIKHMQKTIAENAQRMQYSLDDVPGDAVEVILRHVAGWDKTPRGTSSF